MSCLVSSIVDDMVSLFCKKIILSCRGVCGGASEGNLFARNDALLYVRISFLTCICHIFSMLLIDAHKKQQKASACGATLLSATLQIHCDSEIAAVWNICSSECGIYLEDNVHPLPANGTASR